jgi:hypothetical protein
MTNLALDTINKRSVPLINLMQVLHLQKVKAGMTQVLHVQEIKETIQNLEDQIMEDIHKLIIHLKASSEE